MLRSQKLRLPIVREGIISEEGGGQTPWECRLLPGGAQVQGGCGCWNDRVGRLQAPVCPTTCQLQRQPGHGLLLQVVHVAGQLSSALGVCS